MKRVKTMAVKFRHWMKIERQRMAFEMIACVYVARETHFPLFALALVAWLIVDMVALFHETF